MNIFDDLTPEKISNLSDEEKRELVRSLIYAEDSHVKAVFLNAETGDRISVEDVVKDLGEEEAIEMLIGALNDADTKAMSFSKKEMGDLFESYREGNVTEEEKSLMMALLNEAMESKPAKFQTMVMDMILQTVNTWEKSLGYTPKFIDLALIVQVFSAVNMISTSGGKLEKFKHMGPSQLGEITGKIGDDIYDTWKATLTSEVEDELVILALTSLMVKLSLKNRIPLGNIEEMADRLGVILQDFENGYENGSNEMPHILKPATYNCSDEDDEDDEEDEDMRNLLKD